jgi:hypothetical protein
MKKMENKILKVGKGKKSLTLKEFIDYWFPYQKIGNRVKLLKHIYYVVEKNGTEIIADNYDIVWYEGPNSMIHLYYKGYKIAEIRLKDIKMIY